MKSNNVPDQARADGKPSPVDYEKLHALGRELLIALGEDPDREGLADTPRRWAAWWKEFIDYEAGTTDTTFEAITTQQMVVVSGIRVYSLCEHHLLPFWCDISVGYVTREKVLGLSKFARIAHENAHRLQVQERLVHAIADEVERVTGSPDVAVLGNGVHLCMVMRGIRTDAQMSTLVTRGLFAEKPDRLDDFLRLAERKQSAGVSW